MNKDEGGPAFPGQELDGQGAPIESLHRGMSLRDYFAAKAMQGMIASDGASEHASFAWQGPDHHGELAEFAYRIASAMLAERAK